MIVRQTRQMNIFRRIPIEPDAEIIEHGDKYVFGIENTLDFSGVILEASGIIRWRYQTSPRRSPYSLFNLIRKPDFVLLNPDGLELLRICQHKRLPPIFQIIERNRVVGTIRLRSILRNKCSLDFEDGLMWDFHMPLFTVCFWGKSNVNSYVWVQVGPGKRQWNLLSGHKDTNIRLLSGLAFIHREWWCYS